jgi:hypothetical protein
MARCRFLALVVGVLISPVTLVSPSVASGEPARRLLELIERGESAYSGVRDYTALLRSRERVRGVLEPEKLILLKFQRPFKVYLRWLDGDAKGREGLYVAGANDGKFLVVEPRGLARLFTARLDPTDPRLMARSRHPVTDVGVGRLLEILGANLRQALAEQTLHVQDVAEGLVAGRPVWEITAALARQPAATYSGCRIALAFDRTHRLPLRVVVHDWHGRLLEDYTYGELTLNPGLTPRDFDARNPEYAFARGRLPLSRHPGSAPAMLAADPR